MKKYIFIYLLSIGLFLCNSITFASDLQVTIRQLLETPFQFENQRIVVQGKLMTISNRTNPYGEYTLSDRYGNWIHIEPWLPKGPRVFPGQRAFGKGDTMSHKIGEWFLIKGELKANIDITSGKSKRGISGTHYLIVNYAEEINQPSR